MSSARRSESLSVVLPAYRVASTLPIVVQQCMQVVPLLFADYELIIVDDGSPDATRATAHRLAAEHAPVMVLHHPQPQGFGAALASGVRSARGTHVLSLPPTGQVHPDELGRLRPYGERCAVVLGVRHRQYPTLLRRPHAWLHMHLTRTLLQLDVPDLTSGLVFWQADLTHNRPLRMPGLLVAAELCARARQQGQHYAQIDIASRGGLRPAYYRRGGTARDALRLWRQVGTPLPAAARRVAEQSTWERTALLGMGTALLLRGLWLLLRRTDDSRL